MSRLLLTGVGPMPAPGLERVHATGLRLQSFLQALAADGHDVFLAEFMFADIDAPPLSARQGALLGHEVLPSDPTRAATRLRALVAEHGIGAIVALTDVGALAAVNSGFEGPLWVDYFGHPMAERQQQAHAHGSNASLHQQWLGVLPALLRADRFSACSEEQRLALVGELGAAGRLNAETCGTDLVAILPPTIPGSAALRLHDPGLFTPAGVPGGAPVILSTGGFNTWFDEETLFAGLERVFAEDDRAHFVATGGAIPGHVEVVFERFRARVEASAHRDRYHLLDWVTQEQFDSALLLADVAVNCDRPSLEGELGCRNRLFGWLHAGLRVVTTVTSSPTRDLVRAGIAREVPPADPASLASALLEELRLGRRPDAAELAARLSEDYAPARLFTPLRDWARSPQRAPDRLAADAVLNPLTKLQSTFLAETAQRDATRELLERLHGSRAFSLYRTLHPEVDELMKRIFSDGKAS